MQGGDRQAPTLDDVARAAGVSRATVSRVVNGVALVAPETQAAVRDAIDDLGYHSNRAARSLVTRRSGVVAVVVPEADERVFNDPFFPRVYHGALVGFHDTDTQVVLVISEPGENASRMIRYLGSGHVDGAIVASHHGPELARSLSQLSTPVVFIGDPETPGVPFVDLDQEGAAQRATAHLISRGCRHIATIAGPADMAASRRRLRGFTDALAAAALSPAGVEEGDFSILSGLRAAERLLAADDPFDGLVVASDLMAVGALQALAEAGRRVPDDLLLISFDDSPVAGATPPGLTSMTNPPTELAQLAAGMLIDLLAGRPPGPPVIVESRLVPRGSA
jgi:DNA-binding LacI/PurR family transcriptional regulator